MIKINYLSDIHPKVADKKRNRFDLVGYFKQFSTQSEWGIWVLSFNRPCWLCDFQLPEPNKSHQTIFVVVH